MKIQLSCLPALFMSICVFASCSKKEPQAASPNKYPVRFQLKKDIEILPFPSTRSIPVNRPSDPRTPEETNGTVLFTQIEYVVYHKESGAVVKHNSLTEDNSEDFGEYIYDELETGEYLITLLAHTASGVSLSGNLLTQTDVSDSFHAVSEITIGTGIGENLTEILLKRIVGRIEFAGIKRVPDNADRFILEIEEQYKSANLKTGEGGTPESLRKSYLLSAGTEPGSGPDYLFYTFVPDPLQGDTSYLAGIKLITLDINEDTLHTISLTEIPVMRNRITRFTGSLYAPHSQSSTLELEVEDYAHWKDTIHVEI